MNDFPRKKAQVFHAGQIEEYQIGLVEFEEIECSLCNGSGEVVTDWEGIDYTEECSDCDGAGVVYISSD